MFVSYGDILFTLMWGRGITVWVSVPSLPGLRLAWCYTACRGRRRRNWCIG